MANAPTSWPNPAEARAFFDKLEQSGHDMRERADRAELVRAQIAAANAQEDAARATAEEARARATAIAGAKAEGSAVRARKSDAQVIAMLATAGGYLSGTDTENARALLAHSEKKGFFPGSDGKSLELRTVVDRLRAAREIVGEHNTRS